MEEDDLHGMPEATDGPAEDGKENGTGAPPPPLHSPPPPPGAAPEIRRRTEGASEELAAKLDKMNDRILQAEQAEQVGLAGDKIDEGMALEEPAVASDGVEEAAGQLADEDENHAAQEEQQAQETGEDYAEEDEGEEEVVLKPSASSVPSEPPPAPPTRNLGGLTLSQLPDHLTSMNGMAGDPDDDDVEIVASSPLVSLGADTEVSDRAGLSGTLPSASSGADLGRSPEDAGENNDEAAILSSDQGDPDPSARARDLISRELLDELSHEPDDWNEGRNAPTPPLAGFETPSEPNTPRETGPTQYYHGGQNPDGLMCIDQWDWKTDAPEFVPGSMKGLVGHQPHTEPQQVVNAGYQGGWAMQPPAGGRGAADSSNNVSENVQLSHLRQQYEWQLRSKSEELRDMQQRMNQLEIETAQVRASWEIERRNLVRQIGHYRAVLERYCIPLEEAGNPSYNNLEEPSQYFVPFEPSAPSQWGVEAAGGGAQTAGATASSTATSGGAVGSGGAGTFAGNSQQAGFVGNAPSGGYASSGAPSATGAGNEGGSPFLTAAPFPGGAADGLDSKMRALNNLLKEGQDQQQQRTRRWPNGNQNPEPSSGAAFLGEGGSDDTAAVPEAGNYNSIASTLRAMFPHANIRTSTRPTVMNEETDGLDPDVEERDQEVVEEQEENERDTSQAASATAATPEVEARAAGIENHVRRIERSTGGGIDDRAMRALLNLTTREAKEALAKVEELVQAQGGQCRNLSSILQSVCRKIVKRSPKVSRDDELKTGSANGGPSSRGGAMRTDGRIRSSGGLSRRARQLDEDGDAFDSSDSDGEGGMKVTASSRATSWHQGIQRSALQAAGKPGDEEPMVRTASQNTAPDDKGTPASRRSKSWADIQSGDEDEGKELGPDDSLGMPVPSADEDDVWTSGRVDKAARKGFELRRRGADNWDLKICMGSLEPPFTDAAMERYCRWLRVRLTSFRDEYGAESLRRCRGEVDFSHNHMSNQMVWMLLETLAQHEVHTALLKLFANNISQGGVLAICEFIRMNVHAESLQELHLSHNEIDDEAALELVRTLQEQRPRYPPRRPAEGTGESVYVPVWLRLNHNRIRDPEYVRRQAEAEGISICTAWDRQVCGTSKCVRRDCPLVHLYSFSVQDAPRESADHNGEGKGARRKRNRKERGKDGSKKDDVEGFEEPSAEQAAASAAASAAEVPEQEDAWNS